MLSGVRLFGSAEASEALETFRDKVRGFGSYVVTLRLLRQRKAVSQENDALNDVEKAHEEVAAAFQRLTTVMSQELANL